MRQTDCLYPLGLRRDDRSGQGSRGFRVRARRAGRLFAERGRLGQIQADRVGRRHRLVLYPNLFGMRASSLRNANTRMPVMQR